MIMTNSVNVNLSLSVSVNCKLIGGGGYKNYLYKIEYRINNNKDYEVTSMDY